MSSNVTHLNKEVWRGLERACEVEGNPTAAHPNELALVAALRDCQDKAMGYRGRIKRLMLELADLRAPAPATDDEINRSFDAYR